MQAQGVNERIRLRTQVCFRLDCEHDDHPKRVTFAEKATFAAEVSPLEARVTGVYREHRFTFYPDEYEVL